ncbi:hypothetical protein DAEQUDRAFT_598779 [Daedalea quercina L-15889]|uniref:Uncharacterized protein n=1 Tax=Daedalea quercina L-15889 TaxID=1314783 RepID=A0A165LPK1_9APHY|nr:hypothetical protein DAEQUDRAFT_598779 [Daedalea quercina L-15889]
MVGQARPTSYRQRFVGARTHNCTGHEFCSRLRTWPACSLSRRPGVPRLQSINSQVVSEAQQAGHRDIESADALALRSPSGPSSSSWPTLHIAPMDAFFDISAPLPSEELETTQVLSDYDHSNGNASYSCTIT